LFGIVAALSNFFCVPSYAVISSLYASRKFCSRATLLLLPFSCGSSHHHSGFLSNYSMSPHLLLPIFGGRGIFPPSDPPQRAPVRLEWFTPDTRFLVACATGFIEYLFDPQRIHIETELPFPLLLFRLLAVPAISGPLPLPRCSRVAIRCFFR